MAREIVHDDYVARCEGWCEDLLDIGKETIAIHGTIEHGRCAQAIPPQGGNEGYRLPMSPRHFRDQTLAARCSSITPGHIGLSTSFVDENETFCIQPALSLMPEAARMGDIFAILFGSML